MTDSSKSSSDSTAADQSSRTEDTDFDDIDFEKLDETNTDISDVDLDNFDVEVQNDYWVDYNLAHNGIEYAWQNNRSQAVLAVEDSIAQHKTDEFDVILLTHEGDFIDRLDTCDSRPDALQCALEIQDKYPSGQFPQLQTSDENESDEDEESSDETETTESNDGVMSWLTNLLS